jgi:hypothetical protein
LPFKFIHRIVHNFFTSFYAELLAKILSHGQKEAGKNIPLNSPKKIIAQKALKIQAFSRLCVALWDLALTLLNALCR